MKEVKYARVATVVAALLIVLGFASFAILQFQPNNLQPRGSTITTKRVAFLITSPVPDSYLKQAAGEEAIIYSRSRIIGRMRIQDFSKPPAVVKAYPSYGLLTGDVDLYQLGGSLYIGLMPAKIGNIATLEASRISVQAILYSIKD